MLARLKWIGVRLAVFAAASLLVVLLLEVGFRLLAPQTMMYPRYEFGPDTGIVNHASTTIRHRQPGVFDFTYSVNADRYRGPQVPFSGVRPRIVVLGDSYTFGIGVPDGNPYPAVLERELGGRYRVVNLGNGGWGLTHEIARYLRFGRRFDPEIVILQFSANDPADNRLAPLVAIRADGGLEAREIPVGGTGRFKAWIERSPRLYELLAGHSQLYNFARDAVYRAVASRERRANESTIAAGEQAYYLSLLRPFAELLQREGRRLILIAVQQDLESFPEILAGIRALDRDRTLEYVETGDWFPRDRALASPEGHAWGAAAHARIGEELARYLLRTGSEAPASTSP